MGQEFEEEGEGGQDEERLRECRVVGREPAKKSCQLQTLPW